VVLVNVRHDATHGKENEDLRFLELSTVVLSAVLGTEAGSLKQPRVCTPGPQSLLCSERRGGSHLRSPLTCHLRVAQSPGRVGHSGDVRAFRPQHRPANLGFFIEVEPFFPLLFPDFAAEFLLSAVLSPVSRRALAWSELLAHSHVSRQCHSPGAAAGEKPQP
jgi:hypothetical protein